VWNATSFLFVMDGHEVVVVRRERHQHAVVPWVRDHLERVVGEPAAEQERPVLPLAHVH
jgi:hypothetical protein